MAGIQIPDKVSMNDGGLLQLNGAGIRRKMLTDIYVGALYLQKTSNNAQDIIYSEMPKRIALYFVYKEVSADKLIEGWKDGFVSNNEPQRLNAMQSRLNQSYGYFTTMKAGDVLFLDYIPNQGTRLMINNQIRGYIEGADFYQAALKVWLGEHPAQGQLKDGMLGLLAVAQAMK